VPGVHYCCEMCIDMALNQINEPSCKLQTLQKDIRLAINMSDSVDQPLHVGAAVNEVFVPLLSLIRFETYFVDSWSHVF